ncbi:uncharacterized protein [Chelonus insularis]|uniref:uncharacterized protein n=1 Tax=Chelonus insularis TaxID=460826 RepID=UPI00158EB2E2|nr:uncharacterized protein LOC118073539 [Chelonus insularis]
MTKVVKDKSLTNSVQGSHSRDPKQRLKKKKRKKDLEQLRSNVLATKKKLSRRSLQTKNVVNKTSKNSLEKTLTKFAEFRQKINNKTQGLDSRKNTKKRRICERLLPEPAIGIFRNGATSKEVRKTKNNIVNQIDEARLQNNLFKLLNGEESSSPDQLAESNLVEESNSTFKKDEEAQDEWEHDSENLQFQTHTIKDSPSSNNRKCFKKASKAVNTEQNVVKRRQTHLNMLENVQRVNKSKRRLFENDNDVEDSETINHLQIEPLCFSPRIDQPDDKVQTQKLPKSNVNDESQSIKRWGHCPAIRYEELCAKIQRQHFINPFPYSNIADPEFRVINALSALYMEVQHQNSTSTPNDKYFDDKCPAISFKLPVSNNEIFNSKIRAQPEMKNFIDFGVHKSFIETENLERKEMNSHPHDSNRSAPIDNNLPSSNIIADYARKNLFFQVPNGRDNENRNLETITMTHQNKAEVEENSTWDRSSTYTRHPVQGKSNIKHSSGYNNQYSPPLGWCADMENRQNFAKNFMRHNTKHVPKILRKVNSHASVLFDVDKVESHEINNNKNNRKSMFPHEIIKPTEKIQRHVEFEDNKYIEAPSTILRMVNNEKVEVHNFKLDFDKAMYKVNSSTQLPGQNFIEELDKKKYLIKNMEIKKILDARKKSCLNNEAAQVHKILSDYLFIKSNDGNHNKNSGKIKINNHKDRNEIAYANDKYLNQPKQFPCHSRVDFNAPVQNNAMNKFFPLKNREVLSRNEHQDFHVANFHCSSQSKVPCRRMNSKREVLPQNWEPPNYIHCHRNPEVSFIPINNQTEVKNYENLGSTEMEINDAVLQNFKVLSFEEDQCLESEANNCQSRYHTDNSLRLEHALSFTQPSKYRAVIEENENNQAPQRVPIYPEVEKHTIPLYNQPIYNKTSCQQLLTHQEHQNAHKAVQSGIPVVVFTEKEKNHALVRQCCPHHKVPKSSHPISIRNRLDATNENCGRIVVPTNSILAVKPNIQGDRPFYLNNSNAYEIQLADGRVGLLVSK